MDEERRKRLQTEKDDKRVEVAFDRELFLTCIAERRESLESLCRGLNQSEDKLWEARFDHNVLLPMATLAGATLVWRGTMLDHIWSLSPPAHSQLGPLGYSRTSFSEDRGRIGRD